jgi:hypothetical protein
MNKELTYKLVNSYPKIFSEDFIFECDDGWHEIINRLCKDIQKEINSSGCEQVVARQVKEKYASLRFYHGGGNQCIDKLIRETEEKSSQICEISGNKGGLYEKNGWYKTLSPRLAKSFGYEKVSNY